MCVSYHYFIIIVNTVASNGIFLIVLHLFVKHAKLHFPTTENAMAMLFHVLITPIDCSDGCGCDKHFGSFTVSYFVFIFAQKMVSGECMVACAFILCGYDNLIAFVHSYKDKLSIENPFRSTLSVSSLGMVVDMHLPSIETTEPIHGCMLM